MISTPWRVVLVGVALAGSLCLVGCGAETMPPVPSVPPLSAEETTHILDEVLSEKSARIRSLYPDAVIPPNPDRVRLVAQSEIDAVKADCVTELGFPAVPNVDGGGIVYSPVPPEEQAEAQTLAAYACDVMYPLDPRSIRPYTDAELRYIYAYVKLSTVPCLGNHGVSVPELPSESVFVQSWDAGDPWNPYGEMELTEDNLPETCPVIPQGTQSGIDGKPLATRRCLLHGGGMNWPGFCSATDVY